MTRIPQELKGLELRKPIEEPVSLARSQSRLEPPPGAGTHLEVCAVMVTYNPEPNLEQNVRALLPQVGKLIIVDNQSVPTARALIAHIEASLAVEVIWNEKNLGIARGLNTGIERALSRQKYSWIATFDQDSCVPAGYVDAIFEAYSACPFRDKVAIVGPSYSDPLLQHSGDAVAKRNGFTFREIKSTMTSGSFLKAYALSVGGRFDESLFMDYVDHEFCLRLRKHGFKVIQAGNAVLAHQLGSPTLHHFLGKRFSTSNHSPSRRYHNALNRSLVYRRYLGSEILWVVSDALGWFREMVKVSLVERNRTEKFANVAKGVWHGMQQIVGIRRRH